jgi:hypothetical protein
MLDKADLTLLAVTALVLFASYWHSRYLLTRDAAKIQKYRLYKVRDELVYLVARGELSEHESVFQHFYKVINFLIKHSDSLNLSSFVAALRKARQQGIDPATVEAQEAIRHELQTKDESVEAVVYTFYTAVLEIILENSSLIRLIVKHAWLAEAIREAASRLHHKFLREQQDAYWFYREYARAAQNTSHHQSLVA